MIRCKYIWILSVLSLTMNLHAVKPAIIQSQVKGLLVIELADGSHAGGASQMNATAVPSGAEDLFKLQFNQEIGELMTSATQEVEKFMRVRHTGHLPLGHTIEFGFADKHSPKDGPSVAVACALMTESIIAGVELDPLFAVTGDLTATGDVRPVGGVSAKVRGASRKDCELFAVPKANQAAISDMYVLGGVEAICNIQIILIETFDDALAIGRLDKSDEVKLAIEEFKLVSKAIKNNSRNASHPKVIEKLKYILKELPGHESARLIAFHGAGKGAENLSIKGSLSEIEKAATSLVQLIENTSSFSIESKNALWDSETRLKKLRQKVDKRTVAYLNSHIAIAEFFRSHLEKKQFTPQLREELNGLIGIYNNERSSLYSDQELNEELMDE